MISTYTYEIGLLGGQFSYSTAIGLFNNVINVIMLFLSNKIAEKSNRESDYGEVVMKRSKKIGVIRISATVFLCYSFYL